MISIWIQEWEENLYVVRREASFFEILPAMLAMKAFLDDRRFHLSQVIGLSGTDLSSYGIIPPVWTSVETGYETEAQVPLRGLFFFQEKGTGKRFALSCGLYERGSARVYDIGIIGPSSEKPFLLHLKQLLQNLAQSCDPCRLQSFTFTDEGVSFVRPSRVTFEDVVLDPPLMEEIELNILFPLLRRDEYRKAGLPTKRGILLEGPPGTGKTTVLKALHHLLSGKATFIYVSPGAMCSPEGLFRRARELAPCVLALEDFDFFGLDRSLSLFPSRVVGQMLVQLDGLEENEDLIFIGTTNRSEVIDEALKNRPQRFDRRLYFPLPGPKARKLMLQRFATQHHVPLSKDGLKAAVHETAGLSGSHLKEAVISARLWQFHSVHSVRPNCDDFLLRAVRRLQEQLKESKVFKEQRVAGFREKHLSPP